MDARGWEQALVEAGRTGDDRLRAAALSNLAAVALGQDRLAEAEAGFRAALPLFRVFGDAGAEVDAIDGIARVALARGDVATALALREQAVVVARGDVVAKALELRSDAFERCGRLGEALDDARRAGAPWRVARLHLRRGEVDLAASIVSDGDLRSELALWRGEPVHGGVPAVRALADALAGDLASARQRLGAPATPSEAVLLGLLDHAEGAPGAAADRLAVARAALGQSGWPADAGVAGLCAAAALADAGRAALAEALIAEALADLAGADPGFGVDDLEVTRAHLGLGPGPVAARAPMLRLRSRILRVRFPS